MLQKTTAKTSDIKVTAPATPAIIYSNRLVSSKINTYNCCGNHMFVIGLPGSPPLSGELLGVLML